MDNVGYELEGHKEPWKWRDSADLAEKDRNAYAFHILL